MWLFAAFLAVPLIEIALFIQVGGAIGLWPTLAIVVITAILGTWLVRREGARALGDLKRSFNDLRDPSEPLAHGAMILVSGALLLTPGFFTDACGFALLVPGVRRWVFERVRDRVVAQSFTYGSQPPRQPGPGAGPAPRGTKGPRSDDVIDADFEEVTPGKRPTHQPSGWTRH
ncbi:FxsA family protein [Pseudoroseicyclus tamaricis]|uniref:FxsA family protein n=1 Tax=Pseudoroseicyclus tamaricis TaxID=2705421 RepID=A0A6B2K2I7_9RHOB|nr:FxsA family protein [Pseudoroseicyclus tamaricis]NDV02784.1 FxsA family protein [Pseudoroseicyclus tamaricis]